MPLRDPVPDPISLDLLISVAERGSISAAAKVHGVSQPAASMRLRRLEQVLGVEVLRRDPTGASLTPAGEAIVEWAAAVVNDISALDAGVRSLRETARTHLRVAASMTVAEYLFPGWLTRLNTASDGVHVALVMGNSDQVARWVVAGDADLGFVEGVGVPDGVQSRRLLRDRLTVVVGPRHPWARRRRALTPAELAAAPLVAREVGSGTRAVLDHALALHGLVADVAVELGSTTLIKSAVAAGSGPAVVSELAIRRESAAGQLVEVSCPDLDTERWIRAIHRRGRRLAGPARELLAVAASGVPAGGG